jgi:1-acyl-sn-glycerol-3-phosphate acyltransferase
MIQRLARWLSGIGLNWFYSDIRITGLDRIPPDGPILVAMNHQNALVDAMLALHIVPRELRITAKATLGESLAGTALMKAADIIPLSRASDSTAAPDPIRNRHSFQAIIDELRTGGAVLVFPEGKSHNDPKLAPLKTGLARAALRAHEVGIHGIRIIPVGTTFADKAEPDTAVAVQIGDAISMDEWVGDDAHRLTDAIAARLETVSFTGDVSTPHMPVQVHQDILIRLAAWWGRIMHEIPLRVARRQAVRLSADVGEPAMYTMTLGLAAILVSYLIEVSIIWALFGWIVALIFLASLGTGAYWAAYTEHFPERS